MLLGYEPWLADPGRIELQLDVMAAGELAEYVGPLARSVALDAGLPGEQSREPAA